MKQLVLHNGETFMEAFKKFEGWCRVDNGGGLSIYASPLGRKPYPLDVDAILDLKLSDDETDQIFKNELTDIKQKRDNGTATGVDFTNLVVCHAMLAGKNQGE